MTNITGGEEIAESTQELTKIITRGKVNVEEKTKNFGSLINYGFYDDYGKFGNGKDLLRCTG